MKKLFKFVAMLFCGAALTLTSCEDEPVVPTPEDPFKDAAIEVNLVGADIDAATISVTGSVVKIVSYIVEPTAEKGTYTAAELFEKGSMVALEAEGATQITLRNLQPETSYTVQVAGRISSDKVWDKIFEVKFKTAAVPIIPEISYKVGEITATTADVTFTTKNIARIAYIVSKTTEETEAPNLQVIFATGKVVDMVEGDNNVQIKALSPNSDYVVYVAAEIAVIEEYMEDILIIKGIKTTDFTQDIAIRDINYRGFTVDVRVDPSIKEQKHAIKWNTADLYMYRNYGGGNGMDASMMNTHDTAWNGMNIFTESTSIIVDDAHSYIYDANGTPIDYFYETIVPGQPQVLLLGEFRRGESNDGWGMGYYRPMFDSDQYQIDRSQGTLKEEAAYWTGFYHNEVVQVQLPEVLSEDLIEVEIEKYPDDALVRVKADKSIEQVAVMIMSELEYNSVMDKIGDEKHLQWFATSLMCAMEGYSMIADPYDPELGLNGSFITAISQLYPSINRESKYWVYVVGMRGDFDGDGWLDGNEQVCKSVEFYLPQPTKPAPELVVTALEATSPFEIGFNIKCPTKDAYRGKTIANYEKGWLRENMSAQEIVTSYGIEFSTVELMLINSDEGLDLTYPSRPNEKTYLAAMIANDEGTEVYSDAIIAQSPLEPAAERVESELFESLDGEWTASATVTYGIYNNETKQYDHFTETHTSPVTIGNFEYPEKLDEAAYTIFEKHNISRTEADAYYEEFKAAAQTFIDNTRAQNRILMNGFNFGGEVVPYYEYADPYSLFTSESYNGYTSEMPIYDFGPKWFLEVAADGSVTAPFNVNYFTPLASWFTMYNSLYESHLIAYDPINSVPVAYMGDANGNAVNGHFPVEISEDGNTITVKPMVHSGISYYPNAAIYYGGTSYSMSIAVISEITLTRNTSAAVAPAKVANKKKDGLLKQTRIESKQKIQTPARPASRGALGFAAKYKVLENDLNLTKEQRVQRWIEARRTAGRR